MDFGWGLSQFSRSENGTVPFRNPVTSSKPGLPGVDAGAKRGPPLAIDRLCADNRALIDVCIVNDRRVHAERPETRAPVGRPLVISHAGVNIDSCISKGRKATIESLAFQEKNVNSPSITYTDINNVCIVNDRRVHAERPQNRAPVGRPPFICYARVNQGCGSR